MDANKLREAIKWARSYSDSFAPHRPDHPLVLADAAEAHLATLPRKVTGWIMIGPDTAYPTKEEADEELRKWGNPGSFVVKVEYEVKP